MRRYVATRVAWLVAVLLGASLLTFSLGALAPGDPAEIMLHKQLGHPPTQEQVEGLREQLGLNRSLPVQYVSWLGGAVRGDLGRSWSMERPVSDALVERVPATALLALTAGVFSAVIALPLGVLSAYRRNSLADHSSRFAALVGASVPDYVLSYALILIFAVAFHLVPAFGYGSPRHVLLPAATLALGVSATLMRLTRSSMLEVLRESYMKVAQAKGLPSRTILFGHALRNALIPVMTAGALSLAGLLNGTVIVEWIFAWPGLGKLAIDAIHA
ncbi:MAG: ABC transporter permease, partial [Actinomycetota bacterium]|nr:ABC transporter permease [Actinomycetota bacterium]